MATKPTLSPPVNGLALALKLQNDAAVRGGLMKIKVSYGGFGYTPLDKFLEGVKFADAVGETVTDPDKAVYFLCQHSGSYSHHTTYIPVATLAVDVQVYPTQDHKEHNAKLSGWSKSGDGEEKP
jgi:hypothetical protein